MKEYINFDTIDEEPEMVIPIQIDGDDAPKAHGVKSGDTLNVLPLKNRVLFPGVVLPITLTRPKFQKMVNAAYKQEKMLAVLCQSNQTNSDPTENDVYHMGTTAHILRLLELPDKSMMVLLEGKDRFVATDFEVTKTGILRTNILLAPEEFPLRKDKEFGAMVNTIRQQAADILEDSGKNQEAKSILKMIDNNGPTLINYICANFDIKIEQRQDLLALDKMVTRAEYLIGILAEQLDEIRMRHEIVKKTHAEIDQEQRENYLRHQLQTIQSELGDDHAKIAEDMEARGRKKKWNKETATAFQKTLDRFRMLSTHSADYSLEQNYLETLLELPWNEYTSDNFDIFRAQQVLDNDHYGMSKVKERIIEHLSVLKMRGDMKSPILCLYGPPGVGKTSLGRSIAEALGRKYARVSLGGLHDEAEIRGHRRTYIGAMPGRIIQSIKNVKSSNPVFLLDEIDKIGTDYKGDPTAALLEVLDPEQNNAFHDNYLDIDYDLSKVLFIATANSLDSIPRPLLDRMELIEMTGYTQEEKLEIAKRHLLPKQLQEHGLKSGELKLGKAILNTIIEDYTRESGVRNLDRVLAKLCRKVVTRRALGEECANSLRKEDVISYLGQKRYSHDIYEGNQYVGVVTGLAWTSVGGEILYIEASLSQSKNPTLTLTGNLGDVMKESATLAMGYIRSHATELGIDQELLENRSVHIHVPEGAVPKDGPSAGITITTALVSAFTGKKVRSKIAMTGEMTLRGKVLPIGGVKEKLLAAKRAGITDLILCEDNRKDVTEIEEQYLKGLTFHYVKDIHEVIDYAVM